jgi:ribonuclease HI
MSSYDFVPTYIAITDGGAIGNGNADAYAYGSYKLAVPQDGREYHSRKIMFADYSTNNQAEYCAIVSALKDLLARIEAANCDPGEFTVRIKTDSQLVANQLAGDWKCKNPTLATLKDTALALLTRFDAWAVDKVDRTVVFEALGH